MRGLPGSCFASIYIPPCQQHTIPQKQKIATGTAFCYQNIHKILDSAEIGSKRGRYPRGDPRGCTSESGLAGFPPPFRPPLTPELTKTDHLSPPLPKARNPLDCPALRDGVTSWRGACGPLPLILHSNRPAAAPAHVASGGANSWGTQPAHRALQLGVGRVLYPNCHRRTQRITGRIVAWSCALVHPLSGRTGCPAFRLLPWSSAVRRRVLLCQIVGHSMPE